MLGKAKAKTREEGEGVRGEPRPHSYITSTKIPVVWWSVPCPVMFFYVFLKIKIRLCCRVAHVVCMDWEDQLCEGKRPT